MDHRSKHKSGHLRLPQINLANGLTTKQHVKDSVGRSGFEPDRIAMESLTDFPCFSPKRDFSFVLDFAHRYSRIILDGRQALWKRAQTHLVTRGWHVQVQGLVRTSKIVLLAKALKGAVKITEIFPLPCRKQLPVKRAVKAFIFAHGLRMIRPAVAHPDVQTDQPHRQDGVRIGRLAAPRRAIVHDHGVGKPIESKSFAQRLLNRLAFLVGQSFQAQVKARVIVQNAERMGRATKRGQRSFEIHLPKTIGHLPFEALPVGLGLSTGLDQSVAMKEGRNRTTGGHRFPLSLKQTANLACSPARVALTQAQHGLFGGFSQLPRTVLRAARLIYQTFGSLLSVSTQPLVAALSADAVTLAQLSETHCFFLRHSHKLLTQRHETNNSPRHSVLPLSSSGRIMPLVISKVLPMSPVHLLPMSPVYTPHSKRGRYSGGSGCLREHDGSGDLVRETQCHAMNRSANNTQSPRWRSITKLKLPFEPATR